MEKKKLVRPVHNVGIVFAFALRDKFNIQAIVLHYDLLTIFFLCQLTITDYNGFVLSVKGEKIVTDVTANDGRWHFLSVTWSSSGGQWRVYKDGQLQDRGEGLATDQLIQDGGLVVIGQEQDDRGDDFSAAESFRKEDRNHLLLLHFSLPSCPSSSVPMQYLLI